MLSLDFYGMAVSVRSDEEAVLEEVRRDFEYFVAPEREADLDVRTHLAPPPYGMLPSIPAVFLTPRNVCYRQGSTSYVDYFGRGLLVLDRERGECEAYSSDPHLLREIVYLLLLSTVGEHLDRRGLHRIHALGVSLRGRGVLLLLPAGGGKSTMAMALLERPDVKLLSEDTPLVDRTGRIHPFPLCIGLRAGVETAVPEKFVRVVRRMEFDPKQLVDLAYFGDCVSEAVDPGLVVVGQRNLGAVSSITPLSRPRAVKALMKYLVVGLGVYQGLEFLLERGIWELLGKGSVAASRLRNGLRLLGRARTYRFVMGRDVEKNARTLLRFIEERAEVS